MGTIAFICAMPMELRPLVKQLHLIKGDVGGVPAHVGSVGDRRAVAIVTGMGPDLATQGTQRLLDAVTPDRVVVVGITGAVDEDTPIGSLVDPEVVVLGSSGRKHRPDHILPGTPHGTMWTTDRITPPEELPALRATGVVSLDMETAAIAECCERAGIPWSVVRAISDRATDEALDDEVFQLSNQDGTPKLGAILRYVLRHPGRIPKLAALAKGAKLATERAAATAIDAVRATT